MAKTETKCDPAFQRELDQINTELELEDVMAEASEALEISELLAQANRRGEVYGAGYEDGLYAGAGLLNRLEDARQESIELKHRELSGRWGLY